MTIEQQICETATGCTGAGDFREWAESQGFPYCEVYDWTSSAGNWSFIVSRDGEIWFLMYQENTYSHCGFHRTIDENQPMEGTPDEVFKYLESLY